MSLKSILSHSYGFVKNKEKFIFREIERKDYNEALKMSSLYFTNGIVHKSMRVGEKEANILAKYYVDSYLFNGLSIGVFEKESGKLIGLTMNNIHNFKDERVDRVPKEHPYRSLQLATERDYFNSKKDDDGKFFDYIFGMLYPEYGKHNIFTEMQMMSQEIARLHGCTEMGGICSSLYIYKICTKFGHVCDAKIKVSEFVDPETGLKPFVDFNPKHEYFYWVSLSLKDSKL